MRTIRKLAVGALAGIATASLLQPIVVNDAKAAPRAGATPRRFTGRVILPAMDPVRGEHLFVSKGCVMCHSVNGVGGRQGPKLDATTASSEMNPFDFFAGLWRGAAPMIALQQRDLSHQAELTGQDLADIAAFLHDPKLQKDFDAADNQPAKK